MRLFILVFLMLKLSINAQKNISQKFGKVSEENLKMRFYEKDSSANALILDEFSNVYVNSKRLGRYTLEYYVKIKFFNSNEFDRTIVELPNSRYNYLENIKGYTYNLDQKGKVSVTELNKKDYIIENKHGNTLKFILPNVKSGSIIEYSYSITTSNYKIYEHYFQQSIPVKKLFYKLSISGYPQFFIQLKGNIKPVEKKQYLEKKCKGKQSKCYSFEYRFENIPAFKKENFTSNLENFRSKLEVDRQYTIQTETKLLKDWEALDYMISKRYRNKSTNFSKLEALLKEKIKSTNSSLDKATIIYNFIRDNFTYDKKRGILNRIDFNKTIESKKGSIEEINVILYALLDAFGIKSNIILLNNNNLFITKEYPKLVEYNYLIVQIQINDKTYNLDATNKYHIFGQIPFNTVNQNGRAFSSNKGWFNSYWTSITDNTISSKNSIIDFTLSDSLELSGKLSVSFKNYYALKERQKINEIGIENYKKQHSLDNSIDVINEEITNVNELNRPLNVVYEFEKEVDKYQKQRLRVNPFLIKTINKNPFITKERTYPVQMPFPFMLSSVIKFNFPKGYKLIQYPKNLTLGLPNKGGRCIIKSNPSETGISIYVRLNINKRIFSPAEYFSLKEFYKRIIDAEKSYIILEKI